MFKLKIFIFEIAKLWFDLILNLHHLNHHHYHHLNHHLHHHLNLHHQQVQSFDWDCLECQTDQLEFLAPNQKPTKTLQETTWSVQNDKPSMRTPFASFQYGSY